MNNVFCLVNPVLDRNMLIFKVNPITLLYNMFIPHVEYAERGIINGILFIFSPFHKYSNLGYVPVYVIYRVNQADYGMRILVAACHEKVNTCSTRRVFIHLVFVL